MDTIGRWQERHSEQSGKANEERDYHIFEEFAFYMIEQARSRRINHIFQLEGNVYAFDSTG